MSARRATQLHQHAPTTRAERRAAARLEQKPKDRRGTGIPAWMLGFGAALIIVAVAAFVVVTALGARDSSHNSATTHVTALTHPAALDPAVSMLSTGQRAPNFTLRDMYGMNYSLAAQRGHPVVLEYFAVWCPVCHRETSVMHKLAATYAPKGVRVLAVLANPYGRYFETSGHRNLSLASAFDLAWYGRTYDTNYPLLVDPTFKTVNKYGIGAYPGLYVIGKDGKIVFSGAGYHSYKTLAGTVSAALK